MKQWRHDRHASQLELASIANSSQRHVSFLESGRSQPSRGMVLALAEALDLPLRARNELLAAAGFAPFYPERALASADLAGARAILERILLHHDPYPAFVLDVGWNLLMHNRAAGRLIRLCVPASGVGESLVGINFLRLMCDPAGMRPFIASWPMTGRALLARLRREAATHPRSAVGRLLDELIERDAFPRFVEPEDEPVDVTIPVEFAVGARRIRLINTLTTFGTPQDVSVQELRIEMSFPADDESERLLRELSA